MDLYTKLREAGDTAHIADKLIIFLVCGVALGVLIVAIRAIIGSVINDDDHDLAP